MFSKNYKLKTSNSLKSSYRKVLVQKLKETYPTVTEDDLKEIISPKANLSSLKVITNSDEPVCIYTVDDTPCILEIGEQFYPTIFALWKCPHMVISITIENYLAGKLQSGIIHIKRSHLPPFGSRFPKFNKGAVISVNTIDNEAPILVGIAQYCSSDMLAVQMGTCIKTLNILGDLLCAGEKFPKIDRPQLKPPNGNDKNLKIVENLAQLTIDTDFESEKIEEKSDVLGESNEADSEFQDDDNLTVDSINESNICGFPDDMDGLLKYCLLSVLKVNGKKLTLPLKTNLLYANHMSSFCPPDRTLDVKKSTYKKMGKFLDAMQQEGYVEIKEIEKGVDALVKVNLAHELIKMHNVIDVEESVSSNTTKNDDSSYRAPVVRDVFKVTAAVLPFFTPIHVKKGQTISEPEIRGRLVEYVKINNLQDPQNKTVIRIDPLLGMFTTAHHTVLWNELLGSILSKMTSCTEIRFPDGRSKLLTGKLKQITMAVVNKLGNKKVTIVSNLEDYGISLSAFSKECQHGVAASCTITRTAGSKTDQVQIQGNQKYFVAKHLTEYYGLPKKFIEGADQALAKKNK